MTTTSRPATTAKPAQTAPKPESAASKASRTAPLDLAFLANVKPVSAPVPVRAPGAGRKASDNSTVEGWLQESWDARKQGENVGDGRGITVPLSAIGALKSRFNRAAATLKLGVAFDVDQEDKKAGTARLRYVAKVRKNNTPK